MTPFILDCLNIFCSSLQVYDLKSQQKILEVPKRKTSQLSFSACGNYLSTWEAYYTTQDNPKGSNNLDIYRVGDASVIKNFIQKRQTTWYDAFHLIFRQLHFFHILILLISRMRIENYLNKGRWKQRSFEPIL